MKETLKFVPYLKLVFISITFLNIVTFDTGITLLRRYFMYSTIYFYTWLWYTVIFLYLTLRFANFDKKYWWLASSGILSISLLQTNVLLMNNCFGLIIVTITCWYYLYHLLFDLYSGLTFLFRLIILQI